MPLSILFSYGEHAKRVLDVVGRWWFTSLMNVAIHTQSGAEAARNSLHRLTWRMYCAIYVSASSRAEAIAIALRDKPSHIPAGTELHYGIVGSSTSAEAIAI